MDTAAPGYQPTYDPQFIKELRDETDALKKSLDGQQLYHRWQVIGGGLLTGVALAAALITLAYITPPFHH